jgi:hypothetical protein
MIGNSAQNQDKISNILNHCLELIESKVETIDSIIEKYPEYSDVLRPPLEAAQWLYSRSESFNPKPGFVQLSRRRLIDRVQSFGDTVAASAATRTFFPRIFQERRILIQYSALITLTAVLLFVGYRTSSFLVQRSIPGDFLYNIKLTQEEIRLSLSRSDTEEARLRIEFAQKRIIEMQELVVAGRESFLDETMANFEQHVDKAATIILTIAETDETVATELSNLFAATLSNPLNNLVGILDTTPGLTSTRVLDVLQAVASGINEKRPLGSWIESITPTAADLYTSTLTPTFTYSPTLTASLTPSPTTTPTFQASSTSVVKENPTNTPTIHPTNTPTKQPTDKPTPTTPTIAPSPTNSPTSTTAPTKTPTPTPEETRKPKPTKPTEHPTYWPSHTPKP